MRRILAGVVSLLSAVFVSGCIQSDEDYTLNPDGSGKVVVERRAVPGELVMQQDGKDPDLAALAKTFATKTILEGATGVDAWRDVTYGIADDGRAWVKGTAYFKDLNRLNLNATTEGPRGPAVDMGKGVVQFKRLDDGTAELVFVSKDEQKKVKKPAADLSGDALQAKIRVEKIKFAAAHDFFQMVFEQFRMRKAFRLPGAATDVTGFTADPKNPRVVTLAVEGKEIIARMDQLAKDDALWEKVARGEADASQDLAGMPWGKKAPRAVLKGALTPAFDYEKEAAAARVEDAKIRAELAARPMVKTVPPPSARPAAAAAEPETAAAPPVPEKPLQNVRLGGVRMVAEKGKDWRTSPFNQQEPGLAVAVLADLPPGVFKVKEGMIETVEAENGASLVDEKRTKIHFPSTAEDFSAVCLEIPLKTPPAGTTAVKKLKGSITCLFGAGKINLDSGLMELKEGTPAGFWDGDVNAVRKAGDGKTEVVFNLENFDPEIIVDVKATGEKGEAIAAQRAGWSHGGDRTTITIRLDGAPAKAHFVFTVRDRVQEVTLPFTLENAPLYGAPAPAAP